MKQGVPALAPLLRSNTQGDLLAALLLDDTVEWSLAELERQTGANGSVVHREVDRLVRSAVATDRRVGRVRLVRASRDYELWRPLHEIILKTYGPRALLSHYFKQEPTIEAAYICGSWAARYEGEVGSSPQDVDVLVVGDIARDSLTRIEADVQATLGKEVNITRAPRGWEESADAFYTTLRERPLVRIPLAAPDGALTW